MPSHKRCTNGREGTAHVISISAHCTKLIHILQNLRQELKEEDERLDQMMERERLQGLRVQAKKKEQVLIQRSRYVNTLLGQIEENESKKTEDKQREFKVDNYYF
jgi:uncharacterized protein YigA (DUF484 family)